MSQYKVLFHIDEMKQWKLLLGNVKNLLNGLVGDEVHVEVLANSEAVKFYLSNEATDDPIETMRSLHDQGVEFVACNNALRSLEIKKESLIDFVHIVPSGVVELVKKQRDGYSYIKP